MLWSHFPGPWHGHPSPVGHSQDDFFSGAGGVASGASPRVPEVDVRQHDRRSIGDDHGSGLSGQPYIYLLREAVQAKKRLPSPHVHEERRGMYDLYYANNVTYVQEAVRARSRFERYKSQVDKTYAKLKNINQTA